jgi:hypothetical protein
MDHRYDRDAFASAIPAASRSTCLGRNTCFELLTEIAPAEAGSPISEDEIRFLRSQYIVFSMFYR